MAKLNLGSGKTVTQSAPQTPLAPEQSDVDLGEDFDPSLAQVDQERAAPKVPQGKVQIGDGIVISDEAHVNLMKHLKDRLDWANEGHSEQVDRFEAIDKEVSGFIRLTDADFKRKKDNEKGFGVKAYDINLQLTKVQIDEAVTFLTTVFFPEEGPYNAAAPKDKQSTAKALTILMNEHASKFKHFRTFNKFCTDAFKYNVGLAMPKWTQQKGSLVQNDSTKTQVEVLHDQVLYEGNELVYADPYNTFYDPSVDVVDVATKGEFFAIASAESSFSIQRAKLRGELYNMDKVAISSQTGYNSKYYNIKPDITGDAGKGKKSTQIDWEKWLTMASEKSAVGVMEKVVMYIWMPAIEFELDVVQSYSIWRFEMLNGERIVNAEQVKDAHGMLPLIGTRPWDDNFGDQTQSYAEVLLPYQRFSSFQLNIHQQAARKALYGVTLYLERLMPDLKDADLVACKIPVKSTAELENIDKLFRQFNDVPQTQNTMTDLQNMDGLMQKILPTDMLKQVTDLERATKYQSAATVQGANRRNLKIAQLIESQAYETARRMMVYNILEKQEAIEITDPQTREIIQINPAELRDAKLETTIGAGLRGMDKLILIESLQEMLGFVVQNQQASQEIDVVEVMNYITSLIGDYTNFNQFRFENEFDKLTAEQKNMAFQLLQQAMVANEQEGGAPQPNANPV